MYRVRACFLGPICAVWLAMTAVFCPAWAAPSEGAAPASSSTLWPSATLEDGKWWYGLGALALVSSCTQVDESVRNSIKVDPDLRQPGLAAVGNQWAELGGVGVVAAMYGLGQYVNQPLWVDTSATMAWSSLISAGATRVMKGAGGRLRPYQSSASNEWFEQGESFPSGHTTQAFALSTAFAESVPNPSWQRRAIAYSLAGATAYARMYDDKHWFSDTVAGALVGIVSARFVIKSNLKSTNLKLLVFPTEDKGASVNVVSTW